MRVADRTIDAAFSRHREVYAQAWEATHHVEMWERAHQAFHGASFSDFEWVYEQLRTRWQVFRGSRDYWSPKRTFAALTACEPRLKSIRLSDLGEDDWPAVWALVQSVSSVKTNMSGASVVAVSKFLHFLNPRLFVIVDHAMMWDWVLARPWLRHQIEAVRPRTDVIARHNGRHDDSACDLATYLAILAWSANLARTNPSITPGFARYVRTVTKHGISFPISEYDAAAIEWFLLGLAELPPAGVRLPE
jgi:hypothetical protein